MLVALRESTSARRRVLTLATCALAIQAALGVVVWRRTINPTLLNLLGVGLRGPGDSVALRLRPVDRAAYVFEYPRESVIAYEQFLLAMGRNAAATYRDWQHRANHAERAPRIATFAGGVLPWVLSDAYVFDGLSGFRFRCEVPDDSADYVHVLALEQPAMDATIVSSEALTFDGEPAWLVVYFRANAARRLAPTTIDGACR
jgi:hypothetical protein